MGKRSYLKCLLLSVMLAWTTHAAAQETGTLVVDIKPFHSERELPKKVETQLKNGGLEWGQRDGQLVFSSMNKRFIDFPLNHITRFGQSESLQLAPGEYTVTGIGLNVSMGFNPQKIVDRGGYINEHVMKLHIEAGKTTTLSIDPVIFRDGAFVIDIYQPTLNATVTAPDGSTSAEPVGLNRQSETSVNWGKYNGPLKFVAK